MRIWQEFLHKIIVVDKLIIKASIISIKYLVPNSRFTNNSQQNYYQNYGINQEYNQFPIQSQIAAQPGITVENHQLMIQKYETVLQSLNREFKTSLEQNKLLQEEVMILGQNQLKERRVIEDLRTTLEDKEGSTNTQLLINEKNELKIENESLSSQILELKLKLDEALNENNEIRVANNSLKAVNDKYRDNEYYIQNKYEDARQKISAKDTLLRQKDEIIFGITRENEALKADIRNLESVEVALKTEIDDLVNKRKTLEDINQSLKNQVCEQNIELRRLDSSNNTFQRENQSLIRNIELFKTNTEELLRENNTLKDSLDKLEVSYDDQEILIQELELENSQLRTEVDRVKRNRTQSREPTRNSIMNRALSSNLRYDRTPVRDAPKSPPRIQREKPEVVEKSPKFSMNNFKNQGARSLYDEYLSRMNHKEEFSGSLQQNATQFQDHQFNNPLPTEEIQNSARNERNFVECGRDQEIVNKNIFEYMTPHKEVHHSTQLNTQGKLLINKHLVEFEPQTRNKHQESSLGFKEALGISQNMNNTVGVIPQQDYEFKGNIYQTIL